MYRVKKHLLSIVFIFIFAFSMLPVVEGDTSFPALIVEKDITSLQINDTVYLKVSAFDKKGEQEDFSITSSHTYSTVNF